MIQRWDYTLCPNMILWYTLWPNMIQSRLAPAPHSSFCSGTWADNCRWTCATLLPTFVQIVQIHILHRYCTDIAPILHRDYKWPLLGKRSDRGVKPLRDTRWPHTSLVWDINTTRRYCHRRKSEKKVENIPQWFSLSLSILTRVKLTSNPLQTQIQTLSKPPATANARTCLSELR